MSLSYKTKHIKAFVFPNKISKSICVTVGFPIKDVNWVVVNKKLRSMKPCSCPELSHGSEISCLCFALYENVRDKLMGSHLDELRNTVLSHDCNYQNGEFLITFECDRTVTAIKKILNNIVKGLHPERLYPYYGALIRMINGVPNRQEFNYCVNQLLSGLKDISIIISGKVNMDKSVLSKIIDNIDGKISLQKSVPDTSKPDSLSKSVVAIGYPSLKAVGVPAIIALRYIQNNSQLNAEINSGEIVIYDTKADTHISKLNNVDRISNYLVSKYGKFEDLDQLNEILIFLACRNCLIDVSSLVAFASKKHTVNNLITYVKNVIN